MPTYQYACTKCEHEFEVVQSFSDPAITKCPECGQEVRKDSREKKKTETKPKKDEKAKDTAKKETPKPEKKATKAKTDK